MFTPSTNRRPAKSPAVSAFYLVVGLCCALAIVGIKYRLAEVNSHRVPSWYSSTDPCDYQIGDRYDRFSSCHDPSDPGWSPTSP